MVPALGWSEGVLEVLLAHVQCPSANGNVQAPVATTLDLVAKDGVRPPLVLALKHHAGAHAFPLEFRTATLQCSEGPAECGDGVPGDKSPVMLWRVCSAQ